MTKTIVITYKNGAVINIDVPENYYSEKYAKKSSKKLHQIFMKEYKSFVTALNKAHTVIDVNKHLKFSNATISAENILGVDIKILEETDKVSLSDITVPGVHDKTYLDISETSLDTILKKLETTNLIENLDTFIKKVNSMMSKNNVEVTIKAGAKKKSATTKKVKATESTVDTNIPTTTVSETVDLEESVSEINVSELAPTCNRQN